MDGVERIGGYELIERIAQGGMGTIWKARHPHLDRLVAIKQIRAEVRNDPSVRDAFVREVRHLSKLHSPHIVQVLDFGFTEDGFPFMVTEYLEGEDLRARLEREISIPVPEALRIGIDILKALSEAHGNGLVHRDLKPGNIFLQQLAGATEAGVKVLDFGVAKLLHSEGPEGQLPPSMGAKGSPRFMAPEQILHDAITPAADIYSFGATLYRMLTGEYVFSGTPVKVLVHHVETIPLSVRQKAPDAGIPADLEDLVDGCLKKKPEDRPLSAAALKARMEVIRSQLTQTRHPGEGSEQGESQASHGRSVGEGPGPFADSALPDWFESTASPSIESVMTGDAPKTGQVGDVGIQGVDDLDDWLADPQPLSEPVHDDVASPHALTGDTMIDVSTPEPDLEPLVTQREFPVLDDPEARQQVVEPTAPAVVTEPVASVEQETQSLSVPSLSPRQWALVGGVMAIIILGLGLGFGLSPSPPTTDDQIVRRDASVSEWIEKVGQEIRAKDSKTDRSVPTVVRRWTGAKDLESGRVTLEVEQGPARFVVAATGDVICEESVECLVPIARAVRVHKRGYRSQTLSSESLYDHRETRWRLTLSR